MTSIENDGLFELFGPPDDVLGDYIRYIANGGLTRYRRFIQWGGKEGQPLYAHVIDLVFTLARLADRLRLTVDEQRVLMLVLSVHDLNKLPEFQRLGGYNTLATLENVSDELARIGADNFFPNWRDYGQDIITLMRAHSDHNHVSGELLVLGGNYQLGQGRVEELTELVKALDVLDLSHALKETRHKDTFLSHLNTLSDVQYQFVFHFVAEQRGILSNIIHNCTAEYMQEVKGAWPLLYYPDGVAYLVRRGTQIAMLAEDYALLGERIAEYLEDQTRGKFTDFISSAPSGIKIAPKCLELGIPFTRLWQVVHNMIQAKNYRSIDSMEERARERTRQSIEGATTVAAARVQDMLDAPEFIPHQDDPLRLGELIRSYYNFLSSHFKKAVKEPWERIYGLLECTDDDKATYAYLNLNFDRPYVLAAHLQLSYKEVVNRIVADGQALTAQQSTPSPWTAVFQEYVRQNVQFSFQQPDRSRFSRNLQRYVNGNHKQSAYGSTTLETEPWRSGDVPKTVKVQQFSNRLAAGPGDPVKQIDPITKAQFLLEKLNYPPAFRGTTFYLHIYPHAFFSAAYIEVWRRTIQELTAQDVTALFVKTDDALRSIFEESEWIRLPVSASNSNGLPLPVAPEMIGNVLVWPLNAPGENDTKQFWYAFTCAFAMHRFIGGRVVLTRSAVPILSPEELTMDLFVDEIPLSLQGLLPQNSYTYEDLRSTDRQKAETGLEIQLHALYDVYARIYNPSSKVNELLTVAQSLNDGPLGIFHATERLLIQRISSAKDVRSPEWALIRSSGDIVGSLNQLAISIGGQTVINTIQKLARLAWEGNLKGKSLEKNSLMTALDECFVKVQRKEDPLDEGTLRAAAVEDIYAYLERIREQGMVGDATRVKAKAFVDAFFDDLLGAQYQGNRQRLLNDEKLIRSAFLFHVRDLIPKRSADRTTETVADES